jgi:hypothetical protein
MRPYLMLCGVALTLYGCDRAKPFAFVSDEQFGLKATATASVATAGTFLRVDIDRVAMRADAPATPSLHVYKYTIGIAESMPHGSWQVIRRSTPIPAEFDLRLGETRALSPTHVDIPLDGIADIQNKWLVIETDLDNGHRGLSYARTMALGSIAEFHAE